LELLGTKLHVPRPRRQLVPRSRLVEQLPAEAGPLPRLVLVCAPAGFGKTTLLSQWLTRWQTAAPAGSRRSAWLSLDAEDSDPRRFLTNVVAAIQATAPHVGSDAMALLQTDSATVAPAVPDSAGPGTSRPGRRWRRAHQPGSRRHAGCAAPR